MAESGLKRILLVDDDATLRQSLAEQLGRLEEFSTEEAGAGAEAVGASASGLLQAVSVTAPSRAADNRVCRCIGPPEERDAPAKAGHTPILGPKVAPGPCRSRHFAGRGPEGDRG